MMNLLATGIDRRRENPRRVSLTVLLVVFTVLILFVSAAMYNFTVDSL